MGNRKRIMKLPIMSAASCVYDGFFGNISGENAFFRPDMLFHTGNKCRD
ncbi:hypothetical protein [Ruminococcus flavefaciens]|nr:hypothetical protein [Ruminococcus flavefaciens]